MKLMSKTRIFMKHIVERSPITLCIAESLLNFSIFLPHDNDFYGFLQLAKKRKGLFLDVGANDGRSIRSFHKLKKEWDIFAIEANPLHKPKLRKIKANIKNLKYIFRAVDKISGKELTLYTPVYYFYKHHGAASTSLELLNKNMKETWKKKIRDKIKYIKTTVKTITIDQLNLSPDIIKIDVEGGELNTVLGCKATIKRSSPVFLVEYNPSNFGKLSKFFENMNYDVFGYNVEKMRFVPFSKGDFRNAFFMPNDVKIS